MAQGLSARRLLVIGLALVLAALVYTCLVLYLRSQENRRLEQIEKAKQVENDRRFLDLYGSESVKILDFYASAAEIQRGTKALLCYGVLSAKSVELDPPVEPVHPALSYCFNVTPAKTTKYTLTADGKSGGKATQSVTIIVR
jgi:hypothetical protein